MKGKLVNTYSKEDKNGEMRTSYVYKVIGTPAELQSVADSESVSVIADKDGDNGVKKGDTLVWLNYGGENITLVLTKGNRIAEDTSEERKLIALASRYGANGKAIIADHIAKKMRVSTSTAVAAEKSPVNSDLDLDNIG